MTLLRATDRTRFASALELPWPIPTTSTASPIGASAAPWLRALRGLVDKACATTLRDLDLISLTRRHQLPRTFTRDEALAAFTEAILPALPLHTDIAVPPSTRLTTWKPATPNAVASNGLPPLWPPTEERKRGLCALCAPSNLPSLLEAHDIYILVGLTPTKGTPDAELVMPPSPAELLASFLDLHDDSGLTLGARALTKHAVRSEWYGKVSGTPAQKGLHALVVLARILHQPVHQNVFALPHGFWAYEVRTKGGYGVRCETAASIIDWRFRGFVEPVMAGGHERRWRQCAVAVRDAAE